MEKKVNLDDIKKKKFDCAYLKQESNIISNVVSRASATRAFCPETAQYKSSVTITRADILVLVPASP